MKVPIDGLISMPRFAVLRDITQLHPAQAEIALGNILEPLLKHDGYDLEHTGGPFGSRRRFQGSFDQRRCRVLMIQARRSA